MSRSLGNVIAPSATPDQIRSAVHSTYSDPNHLYVNDPGQVEGNVVFTYLDTFDDEKAGLDELKARSRRGALGDEPAYSHQVLCAATPAAVEAALGRFAPDRSALGGAI